MRDIITKHFKSVFEAELLEEIIKIGEIKTYPKDTLLMDFGEYMRHMPLIIDGAIKISRIDKNNDELFLYFLKRGQSCAMTLSYFIGHHKSEIKAVSETETSMVLLPVDQIEIWISKYKSWRKFVFENYHERFIELLDTIDTIAFSNTSERLLHYLSNKAEVNKSNTIKITHQEIAFDLNTSRVVISRLLKTLEQEGEIKLERNKIYILSK
ncbi:Crp/Fnr family transcriptional regulator [Croceibacter atlanticus]|uniref:Crp/Fnr family transcriptional regulator n=1 Tax=Croceibacter atlanticus TaxID=313588 RepID=UPI0024935504|nr:Crp/Fnr family transcriptional regulator [Croceibacter atlanticus]